MHPPHSWCCPVHMSPFPDTHHRMLGSLVRCWLSRFALTSPIFSLLQVCTPCNSSQLSSKIGCRALINRNQLPNIPSAALFAFSQLPLPYSVKPKSQSQPKPSMGRGGNEEWLCIPRSWVATARINSSFCVFFTEISQCRR